MDSVDLEMNSTRFTIETETIIDMTTALLVALYRHGYVEN